MDNTQAIKVAKVVIKEIAEIVIWFAVFILLLNLFLVFFKFPKVVGSSMEPNYSDGERVFVFATHNVKQNDVVVLWSNGTDEYLIKRVIGVAGDHIVVNENGLYRNGVLLSEDYLLSDDWAKYSHQVDVVVAEDTIFVMGDNRNNSADSREFGAFPISDIYGKVLGKANWVNRVVRK